MCACRVQAVRGSARRSASDPVTCKACDALSRRRRYRGVALVWVAVTILVLVGIVGLSLDYAWGALAAHQLHNGADAGAMAGALVVRTDWVLGMQNAIAVAHRNYADLLPITVASNPSNDPNGEVVVGRWVRQERQFYPTIFAPNAVKVMADRSGLSDSAPAVSLLFGQAFGKPSQNMKRHAIAMSMGQRGAGILVLSRNPELDFAGNRPDEKWTYKDTGMVGGGGMYIDLRGPNGWVGDIQVNSNGNGTGGGSEKDAFVFNGSSAEVYANNFNVVGTSNPAYDDPKWESLYPPAPEIPFSINTGVDYMEDPLQNVPAPNVSAMTVPDAATITDATIVARGYISPTDPGLKILELDPGYYPGGINLAGAGSEQVTTPGPDGIPNTPDDVITTLTYRTELRLRMGTTVETSVFAVGGAADGTSGVQLGAGARLIGNGVTIYVTGAQTVGGTTYNVQYGKVTVLGHGYIEVSPPGDYFLVNGERQINGLPGISIWQDRGPAGNPPPGPFNTRPATLGGTASYNLSGTLYFGYSPVTVSGNLSKSGNQLLAGALDVSGSINLGVAYDGRNREDWTRSLLVE